MADAGEPMNLPAVLARRAARVRAAMTSHRVEVLGLSVGADLRWLTGYEAMPLERLTLLVFPADGDATLLVPRLEAPRVVPVPDLFAIRAWDEDEDPLALAAGLIGARRSVAVGDRTWARFLLGLQRLLPGRSWSEATQVTGDLRAVKDPQEIDALRRAAAAADRVAAQLQGSEAALAGRTEAEVSRDLSDRLLAEGHQRVNFAIVGSGPNAASPHHEPGARRIGPGDVVVCDFGGSLDGYCSDITRTVVVGEPTAEQVAVHGIVAEAQAAGVAAARAGATGAEVDAAARTVITEAGYGKWFIHRTGHGIGTEEHEEPYLAADNRRPLVAGNAFSVEPGIYLPGRFGVRIEDIVVVGDHGPEPLNSAHHGLAVVG